MSDTTVQVSNREIEHERGRCWVVPVPELVTGDSTDTPNASRLQLFEDEQPLGEGHSAHDDIRKRGGGLFSHWGDMLYFSTSDNADPRTSNRKYTVTSARREGYIPHVNVIRGYEVVPSFVGQPLLSSELLDEMEHHHEAAGKSSWGTRNILHAYILSLRPKTILEIGAHIGSASVVMGAALKANNYGLLYCLEPQDHYFKLLCEFVEKAEVAKFVAPLKMFSTSAELMKILPEKVEIVYLDANHSYSHARNDLDICDRIIADNGLIFLDDVGPDVSPQLDTEHKGGVRQAVIDFTKDRNDLHVTFLEPPFWLNPCGLGIICKQTIVGRSPR